MARNRFEQVDEAQSDAITLELSQRDGEPCGTVTFPALEALQQAEIVVSDSMTPKDAFRAAIRVANEIKVAVVVIDPDALWQAEWGDLFRAV
jgi:hypothetical protein